MAGIILDADENQEYIERQLKKEAASDGNGMPDAITNISKRKIREVYIPPEELDELRQRYSRVVVQDFEDDYHMTKEEREKQREQYSKFFRLKRNYAKKIRRLDKYVEACRLVFEIINDTADEAETDHLMSKDTFITSVLNGKITIRGLTIPKYVGKGKKSLNWDYVMEFVLDPNKDIDELIRSQQTSRCKSMDDDDFEPEDVESIKDDLTPEEYQQFKEFVDNYQPPVRSFYDGSIGEGYATIETDKMRKQLVKQYPGFSKALKEMYNNGKKNRDKTYLWQLEEEDLQWIKEFKEEASKRNGDARPEFTGSIMDEEAVGRYLFELDQWEKEHNLVKYGSNMVTQSAKEELDFKAILEQSGYNLRNLYGNKQRTKEMNKKRKLQSKKIDSLKKMLEDLNAKQKKTNLEGLNGGIESIDLGGDAVNKKKKKKKKPKGKKAKKMEKQFEGLLLDAIGSDDKDMKSYEKRMQNMIWDNGGDK